MLYCRIVCKTHSLIGWQCHDDDDDDDVGDDDTNCDDDVDVDAVYHILFSDGKIMFAWFGCRSTDQM